MTRLDDRYRATGLPRRQVSVLDADHSADDAVAQQDPQYGGHRCAGLASTDDPYAVKSIQIVAPLADKQRLPLTPHRTAHSLPRLHRCQRRYLNGPNNLSPLLSLHSPFFPRHRSKVSMTWAAASSGVCSPVITASIAIRQAAATSR